MKEIFSIYKPKGWSSYDVIRALKKKFPGKKIGHGGALDPLAEGVLVIAIGRKNTKKLDSVLKNSKKEYIATIVLGKKSDTYDISGKIKKVQIKRWPDKKDIIQALEKFKGESLQKPPLFSAVKISGIPAYKLARQGKIPKIRSKKVNVFKIKLLGCKKTKDLIELKIRLIVSSGFYIRSLADDLGNFLKTGGVLKNLIRTKAGSFTVEKSIHLENI